MRIIFVCGSIEPGNDGVGDYTRRICGELIRTGHDTRVLSLCDQHHITFSIEKQYIEGTEVEVFRIPKTTSNKQRYILAQTSINNFKPDWISLQYVPYSFNPKGLPFWLPSFLKKIRGNHQWHIMFHELWLGIDGESSFKHKCIGKLQQLIVKKIIYKLNSKVNNTQNKLYQFHLQSHTIVAGILPIFGNIPFTALKKEEIAFTQFVLFGTLHYGAPFKDFIEDLLNPNNKFVKPLKFVFIGDNGVELSNFTSVLKSYTINYEVLGIQSETNISQVLFDSDFGISTTPYFQTEKSGVYAAYREHQLNTICVSRKWTPQNGQYIIPKIIKYEKNNLKLIPMDIEIVDLSQVAKQFINSIS